MRDAARRNRSETGAPPTEGGGARSACQNSAVLSRHAGGPDHRPQRIASAPAHEAQPPSGAAAQGRGPRACRASKCTCRRISFSGPAAKWRFVSFGLCAAPGRGAVPGGDLPTLPWQPPPQVSGQSAHPARRDRRRAGQHGPADLHAGARGPASSACGCNFPELLAAHVSAYGCRTT